MVPLAFASPIALNGVSRFSSVQVGRRSRPEVSVKGIVRAVVQVTSSQQREAFEAVGDTYLDPPDGLSFSNRATKLAEEGQVPEWVANILLGWFPSYREAVFVNKDFNGDATEYTERTFTTLLELARRYVQAPVDFHPYHERVRRPFDYYKFAFDFAAMLLNTEKSTVSGMENILQAVHYAEQGHNVVFFSNHQSEGDPFAIDAMLSFVAGIDRTFCEEMIFMAGDRVRDDPVIAPFTVGRNLLTVYSKKHIRDVPELMEKKLVHNRRTIGATATLFKEGGKAVWFAPSGGRDRRCKESGIVEISPFDVGAVHMMRVAGEKSGTPTHLYPMALWTYDMLPPPASVGGVEMGEERIANHIPMHMWVGQELAWDLPPDIVGKEEKRKAFCDIVYQAVQSGYEAIGGYDS